MSNSDKIDGLLTKIKPIEHPVLIGLRISYFIADALKQRTLSLYECFLLNDEYLDFQRTGYIQPAWNFKVSIKICIELLNQALLARIFNEADLLKKYTEWGMEAYRLNGEKRKHYILDSYPKLLDVNEHRDLLEDLVKVRNRFPNIGDSYDPCHVESFPYEFYSPEGILLGHDKTEHPKDVSNEIANLIGEIVLRH